MALITEDHKRRGGFTLLEVLAAITILTLGLLAIASMQTSSIRGNATAGSLTDGVSWASDEMEKLMALPFDDTALADSDGDGAGGLEDDAVGSSDHQASHGIYTLLWNVADNDVANNTKTINVFVLWTDHGVQKRVSMRYLRPRVI